MLKEHCFDRKYVIVPYGTIFVTLVTKGLKNFASKPYEHHNTHISDSGLLSANKENTL